MSKKIFLISMLTVAGVLRAAAAEERTLAERLAMVEADVRAVYNAYTDGIRKCYMDSPSPYPGPYSASWQHKIRSCRAEAEMQKELRLERLGFSPDIMTPIEMTPKKEWVHRQ